MFEALKRLLGLVPQQRVATPEPIPTRVYTVQGLSWWRHPDLKVSERVLLWMSHPKHIGQRWTVKDMDADLKLGEAVINAAISGMTIRNSCRKWMSDERPPMETAVHWRDRKWKLTADGAREAGRIQDRLSAVLA
jgi:hypothetical protein